MLLKTFVILLALFSIPLEGAAIVQQEPVLLLSYPRSGNTWTRYCIEFITKRPTGETYLLFPIEKERKFINCALNNTFDLGVDYNAPPVIKTHHLHQEIKQGINEKLTNQLGCEDLGLLTIIRNYKECVPRHMGTALTIPTLKDPENMYLHILQIYDEWPEDRRLLIYYEDLILFPEKTLHQLAEFFQVDHASVSIFLKNLPLHRENAICIYEQDAGESTTRGENIYFHSKFFTKEDLILMDKICEESNPELFKKYLSRYKEL